MVTSINVAHAITNLVAADALPAVVGSLVAGNLVNRSFEPTTAQPGDEVPIPVPPVIWACRSDQSSSNTQPADVKVLLNMHIESTFQIPDVTKVLCVPDLLRIYMQSSVNALVENIESNLLRKWKEFTANKPCGAFGTPVTESVIDHAEIALFKANVPLSARHTYLIVDPDTYMGLRQQPMFYESRTASEAGLRSLVDGPIGSCKNFFVFRSNYVQKTGDQLQETHNLAFAKDALGLVMRRLEAPKPESGVIAQYAELGNFGMRIMLDYKPNTLIQQFTIDMLYGVAVLRNNFAVQVNS